MSEDTDAVERAPKPANAWRGGRPLVALVGLQTLAVLALAVWLFVLERPIGYREEWRIQLRPPSVGVQQPFDPLLVVVGFGSAAGYITYLMRRHDRDRWRRWLAALFVVTLVVGVYALQVACVLVPGHALPFLVASTFSEVATEYFVAADHIMDVGEFLRHYDTTMLGAEYHLGTHPPGAVLVYRLLVRVSEEAPGLTTSLWLWVENTAGMDAEWMSRWAAQFPGTPAPPPWVLPKAAFCSLALPWFGALSLVPLYLLAVTLGAPSTRPAGAAEAGARKGRPLLAFAVLMPAVPSLILFVPALDQVVLFCAAWSLYAVVAGWAGRKPWASLLGGLALGIGCFVSFGLAAVGPVLALYLFVSAAYGCSDRRSAMRQAGLHLALLVAGVLVIGLLVHVGLGVDLAAVWQQGMAAHADLTHTRTYVVWLGLNLVEFAVFLGLPLAVALAAALSAARPVRDALRDPGFVLAVSALAVILLLDVSGRVRGEVGRIWLFLMPPLALYAASWLGQRRWWAHHVGATIGLQIVQLWLMALALTPLVRPY